MLASLVTWLRSEERIDPTGHGLSWTNPDHPGYPYPEISGLLLAYLARIDGTETRREGLARALAERPGAGQGVGRHGISYTFDTAMALRGVIRGSSTERSQEAAAIWAGLLVQWVGEERARSDQPSLDADTRWSDSFGSHQSKVAGALLDLRDHPARLPPGCTPADIDGVLDQLVAHTLGLQADDGRFRIHAKSARAYLHAHCYAVEGLLMRRDALARWSPEIVAAADFLADVQQSDGGVRAWYDDSGASGPVRADATAQAVRIFRLVDPDRYAGSIAIGLGKLLAIQAADGGIPYEPGAPDLATWPGIFAAQALAAPGEPGALRDGTDLV